MYWLLCEHLIEYYYSFKFEMSANCLGSEVMQFEPKCSDVRYLIWCKLSGNVASLLYPASRCSSEFNWPMDSGSSCSSFPETFNRRRCANAFQRSNSGGILHLQWQISIKMQTYRTDWNVSQCWGLHTSWEHQVQLASLHQNHHSWLMVLVDDCLN